jgi:hypothetical protein
MVRFLKVETVNNTERWQVEYREVSTGEPVAIAFVAVEPSYGYTAKAKLLGLLIGDGLPRENGIANLLIEKCRFRWIGLRRGR